MRVPSLPNDRRLKIARCALAASLLLCARLALADGSFEFGGFGSLGASCFSDSTADYGYNTISEGPGYSRRCDAGLDSILGLQANWQVNAQFDTVLQVVSERDAHQNFKPQFTNANVRWKVREDTTVRVGRVTSPMFLESDYRLVRFALPTIRPPESVYGHFPNFVVDGVDVSHKTHVGSWDLEAYAGLHRSDFQFGSPDAEIDWVRLRKSLTSYLQLDRGPWTAKLSLNRTTVTYLSQPVEELVAALQSIDPSFPGAAALGSQLDFRDVPFDLYAAALRYDSASLLVEAEYALRRFQGSFFRDSEGLDLLAGYRIGPWMPYAVFERRITSGPLSDPRAGPLSPEVGQLLQYTRYDGASYTAGLSREVARNTTVKGEIQWLHRQAGDWGYFTVNNSPGFELNQSAWDRLYSLSVCFAF
jgi:hypothetical protein